MTFKQYLTASTKTYNYRLKTLMPVDKQNLAVISDYLEKFDLQSVPKVIKTPLQKNPMEFEQHANHEVFIVDFTIGLPISPFVIQAELVGILGLPGDYLKIRGENDPLEIRDIQTAQQADLDAKQDKMGATKATLLDIASEYPEGEQTVDGQNYFGDSYNKRFLEYLKQVSDEKKAEVEKNSPVEAKFALFGWLKDKEDHEPAQDVSNFNDGLAPDIKPADKGAKSTSKFGNFDDEGVIKKRSVLDKQGKKKTLTSEPSSVRKD